MKSYGRCVINHALQLFNMPVKDCQISWWLPGHPPGETEYVKNLFNPNVLTLGFARRFATYKRPDLLLHDPQRLMRLLSDPLRPNTTYPCWESTSCG